MSSQIIKNLKYLSQPSKIGNMPIKNQFIMAPLTRQRGDKTTGIPSKLMEDYYSQRANFGLIITECSQISKISNAFPGSGGIFNKQQAEGWKKITEKVHLKDSKIILQIWHAGRAVPTEFIQNQQPISSSPLAINTDNVRSQTPHPVPKEMSYDDIKKVIEEFRQGAIFAKEAGFDGVQLHGANGYLVDQFLRDSVNKRTDNYGGSLENRCRFMMETLEALTSIFGTERTSIRLSPTGRNSDMYDSNPLDLMKFIFNKFNKEQKLQFIEVKRHGLLDSNYLELMKQQQKKQKNQNINNNLEERQLPEQQIPDFYKTLRPLYDGILMGNDGFTPESAEKSIQQGEVDFVSFGKLAISNPDLPYKYQNNIEYNTNWDPTTFFTPGGKGYTDY